MNLRFALVICSILGLLSTARAADDQSTPKGTLKVFARATREADRAKLRACLHAADANEARLADAMADATSALARLRLSAIARFGEAKVRDLNAGVPSEQEIAQIDAAGEKIDGDSAVVTVKPTPRGGGGEMRLVRIDGTWKIAITPSVAGKTPELLNSEITALQTTAKIVLQVAEEISAGKYKTAREATDALAVKMAMEKRAAASQPAAQR